MKPKNIFKFFFPLIVFSSFLSLTPINALASSLTDQIAQFHNGTTKLTVVKEEQKNLAAKKATAHRQALLVALKQDRSLKPLSERLRKEEEEESSNSNKVPLTLLGDLQKKPTLNKVTKRIQKIE